jgi:predicted transposase YdaD
VYKVMLEEHLHIVDVEFETGSHPHMEARLLDYHAYLYRKYRLPVISIIVYPFRTKMAISPLREVSGKQELLLFHFRMLPLWQLKAERYLNEHAVLMYSLLPSMEGANTRLLSKAIDEMIEYYQDDQTTLAQELRWMGIVLRRADTVPIADKRQIEERLNMYDDLFEKDPKMRRIRAESKAEGRAEGEAAGEARGEAKGEARGEAKGKAEGLQLALVTVIEERFPPLAELVQGKITRIDRPDALRLLLKGIAAAPDEASARLLLELLVA